MLEVASLHYGTVFKKAFSIPEVFTAFVKDIVGVDIEIDEVKQEKSFNPPIGPVDVTFDLHAQDRKNRIIVDIQHKRHADHYDRFAHYTYAAILEQVSNSSNYRPKVAVYTIVVLTSGDRHKTDVSIIDQDPHDLSGKPLGEIPHKTFFLAPKYVNENTPGPYREWMQAINDSMDGQVDQNAYTRPEIQKVFNKIKRDLITPQERARMIEEGYQEEVREEGVHIGSVKTSRAKLILLLQRMFGELSDDILFMIKETEDIELLDKWFEQGLTVENLDEINFGVAQD